jgi:lipopolysaccharide transport system ATP-binding protein
VIKTKGRIASLLEVGTGFHPEMTGRENIYLNGAILGMTKAEIKRKEDEIIDFSGCARYIDTPVKRYSSGMRVRLAFAVAAFLEPDILVVDEVLAVGDAEFQKKAVGKMQDISKGEGRTVLFVSHNMAAVKTLCSRGMVIKSGKIDFNGTSEEAVNFYLEDDEYEKRISLLNRTDRFGSGEIIFSEVSLYNKEDKRIQSIVSGDYLKIRIKLEFKFLPDEKLVFAFSIYDSVEQLKSMIVSDEMNLNINDIIQKGYIEIQFNRFLFRGGQYDFHFLLSRIDTKRENQIDNIRKAFQLKVLQGDVFKTGKLNRSYAAYLIPCKIS